jgi:hypothetical protein
MPPAVHAAQRNCRLPYLPPPNLPPSVHAACRTVLAALMITGTAAKFTMLKRQQNLFNFSNLILIR